MLTFKAYSRKVRSLAFCAGGERLASIGGTGKSISLWDLRRLPRKQYLSAHEGTPMELLSLSAGTRIISRDTYGILYMWDIEKRESVSRVGGLWSIIGLGFANQETTLQAVQQPYGRHPSVALFRVTEQGIEEKRQSISFARMPYLAFNSVGTVVQEQLVAVGDRIGRVLLLDMVMKQVRHTLETDRPGRVYRLAFSPNTDTLAVGAGHFITLWDTTTGTQKATFKAHRRMLTGLAFTPEGYLVSCSTDHTVKIWQPDSDKQHAAFDWEIGPLACLHLSRDGMRGVCGSDDGRIVVWDLDV